MKFFNVTALILIAAMIGGCRKNEDGSRKTIGMLPGNCNWAVQDYSGDLSIAHERCQIEPLQDVTTCHDRIQDVAVKANVIDFPGDRIYVFMVKADGTKRGIPAPNIILGRGIVRFLDASVWSNGAGYSTYEIHEEVCR